MWRGYNVHSIVLQVPKSRLVANDPTIGVWSSTYRRQVKVLNDEGTEPFNFGRFVSVSRLGHAAGERGGHPARQEGPVQRVRARTTTRSSASTCSIPS